MLLYVLVVPSPIELVYVLVDDNLDVVVVFIRQLTFADNLLEDTMEETSACVCICVYIYGYV